MIDTDKYEGHTEGPWQAVLNDTDGHMDVIIAEGDEKREAVLSLPCWVCEEDMLELTANAELIADAPLLLAEVKRLREALIAVQQSLIWDEKDRAMDGDPITLEALVAQVEQVRSDITEMIE